MATATALVSNARTLNGELARCTQKLEEVRERILARAEPNVVRRQFRQAQSAMMCLGRALSLDNRFRPRLPAGKREQALDMLRNGAKPIQLKKQLGVDNGTARRLRRELGDNRDLNRVCKLNADQIAKIRSTGRATTRRTLAEQFNVSMSLISKIRNGRGPYRREAAVSVSPVQQTTTAKPPGPATTNGLSLRLNGELARTLAEMAQLAHSELAPFVIELVEVQVAAFRAKPVPADFLIKPDKTPVPEVGDIKPRGKLSPEDRERIIMQRAEGMSISGIAQRWHVGESSVRRALERAKKKKRVLPGASPETVQRILFLGAKKYDGNDEFIGFREIAKAVGESESCVRSVLANHHPLTPSTTAIYGRPPRPGGWSGIWSRAE